MKLTCVVPVLLVTIVLLGAKGQSTAALPEDQFYAASGDSLIKVLELKRLGSSGDPMEKQIQHAVASLRLPQSEPIWICHGSGTAWHPGLGTLVDTEQVSAVQRESHLPDVEWILRFLLAHEHGHQQQYEVDKTNIATLSTEERQVREAQADVLAGMALYRSLSASIPRQMNTIPESMFDPVRAATRAVYDMGSAEYTMTDHPSRLGRLQAIRLGITYAGALEMTVNREASAQVIREQLDLQSGEETMPYTRRMARAIVQAHHQAARDLVFVYEEDKSPFVWNTQNDRAGVTYDVPYRNRGDKAVLVWLEVRTLSVDRTEPNDVFKWANQFANVHRFRVEPGATYRVQGRLPWTSTVDKMPECVYPPDARTMIEVEYADNNDVADPGVVHDFAPLKPLALTTAALLAADFSVMTNKAMEQYANVAAGVGFEFSRGSVQYPSSQALTGAAEAHITFPPEKSKPVRCTLRRL